MCFLHFTRDRRGYNLSGRHTASKHRSLCVSSVKTVILQNRQSHLQLHQPCTVGLGVCIYNSAQYYWSQIMINNDNTDENGTLALTSDLICRPLCTLWCIQYHNHAWVHLVWESGGCGINGTHALTSREKTSHLQILCWQCIGEQTQSHCLVHPSWRGPLIHQLTYSPASVQRQTLGGKRPPPPPNPLSPSLAIVSLH